MKVIDRLNYGVLEEFPKIKGFLESEGVYSTKRMPSIWRKENFLLRADCDSKSYMFKHVRETDAGLELDKVRQMGNIYPSNVIPSVQMYEGSAYLMDFVHGKSFFDLERGEKIIRMSDAGKTLRKLHSLGDDSKKNIADNVRNSFERYRKKSERFFEDGELRLLENSFEKFSKVPGTMAHGDLNAANLIYTTGGEIKMIDPSEEGFEDIARDIGRYAASCFFNNYDYFGGDLKHSLDIADSFLNNFDYDILERARHYMGESFLSFLNFDTKTTPKSKLKNLALIVLEGEGDIVSLLERGLK